MKSILKKLKKSSLFFVVVLTLLILAGFFGYIFVNNQKTGVADILLKTPKPEITATPSSTPTPTPSPSSKPIQTLSKDLYKIAIIGDSMVDTMGGNLEYLLTELKAKYPGTNFYMYNYGIGGENVIKGLARFDSPFSNQGRVYPSISEVKPDIIIVGSWGYNPLVEGDRNTHRSNLIDVVNKAKGVSTKVYMLREIAPLADGFGKGPGGVNWPEEFADPHVIKILDNLDNVKGVGESLGVPVIDVYGKSTYPGSRYGKEQYVSTHDGIHPSVYGHSFTASIIAGAIKLD